MKLSIIATLSSLILLPSPVVWALPPLENTPQIAQLSSDLQKVAQAITVKIIVKDSEGSGFIVAKNGNTYTVATNAHVVSRGEPYRIQTPDGQIYQATLKTQGDSFKGYDLALLEFESTKTYEVAAFDNSGKFKDNQEVFAVGFPFESNQLTIIKGNVSLVSQKPLAGGYQIGFNGETPQGMSGGALFNDEGKVIGIIGMGNFGLLDRAYTYQDGTMPDETILAQIKRLSFAVPIAKLADMEDNQPSQYSGKVAEIDKIAQQITVRIDSLKSGNGSGSIIAKEGKTYYVLTAAHVVSNPDNYQLITPDGQGYPIKREAITFLEGVDLAVVKFDSNKNYQVATLGNYQISLFKIEEISSIFVSGFPALKTGTVKRLLTYGGFVRADLLGSLLGRDLYSFENGYNMIYTNLSYGGMSGGPILDLSGQVIGVNTASDSEYRSDESGEMVEIPVGFSLGISINTFLSLVKNTSIKPESLQIKTSPPPTLTESEQEAFYSQFILNTPKQTDKELDWLIYGLEVLRLNKLEEALKAFEQAISLKPDFDLAYYAKGMAWANEQNFEQALVEFEKATQVNPELEQAWRWKSIALANLDRHSESLTAIDQSIKLRPTDALLYQFRLFVLFNLEDYQEALKTADKMLALQGNNPNAYFWRGLIYVQQQDYQKALTDLSKAIELNSSYAEAYGIRGGVYRELGDYQKAIVDFSKAIEIQPDWVEAYNGRGGVYLILEDPQKAITDLSKAIELNPDNADAFLGRGVAYLYGQDYEKGMADLAKAIALKPDYAEAYVIRGKIYSSLQEYQKAIADYSKAVELQPDYAEGYVERGASYIYLQDYPKAITDLSKAIELKPDYTEAYVIRGKIYSSLQEYQKAIADYSKAVELQPDYAEGYAERGASYIYLEDYPKAITDLSKAIELQPDYADAYMGRGAVYLVLQEVQKARVDLEKAAELYKNQGNTELYESVQQMLAKVGNGQ